MARNPTIIEGQAWNVERAAWRETNRGASGGGYTASSYTATRIADGRTCTAATRPRLVAVIADRIRRGVY